MLSTLDSPELTADLNLAKGCRAATKLARSSQTIFPQIRDDRRFRSEKICGRPESVRSTRFRQSPHRPGNPRRPGKNHALPRPFRHRKITKAFTAAAAHLPPTPRPSALTPAGYPPELQPLLRLSLLCHCGLEFGLYRAVLNHGTGESASTNAAASAERPSGLKAELQLGGAGCT